MKTGQIRVLILTMAMIATSGCRVTFDTHYQKLGNTEFITLAPNYVVDLEIVDVSDETKPETIALPKIMIIAGHEGSLSIGEKNKQFIEVDAQVEKDGQIGHASVNIVQGNSRTSGKLTTTPGQVTEFRSGKYLIRFSFNPAKIED